MSYRWAFVGSRQSQPTASCSSTTPTELATNSSTATSSPTVIRVSPRRGSCPAILRAEGPGSTVGVRSTGLLWRSPVHRSLWPIDVDWRARGRRLLSLKASASPDAVEAEMHKPVTRTSGAWSPLEASVGSRSRSTSPWPREPTFAPRVAAWGDCLVSGSRRPRSGCRGRRRRPRVSSGCSRCCRSRSVRAWRAGRDKCGRRVPRFRVERVSHGLQREAQGAGKGGQTR